MLLSAHPLRLCTPGWCTAQLSDSRIVDLKSVWSSTGQFFPPPYLYISHLNVPLFCVDITVLLCTHSLLLLELKDVLQAVVWWQNTRFSAVCEGDWSERGVESLSSFLLINPLLVWASLYSQAVRRGLGQRQPWLSQQQIPQWHGYAFTGIGWMSLFNDSHGGFPTCFAK